MITERRGIVLPIDAHGINRLTLERVVTLARQLDRSLLGLILDSPDLRRIAELPFTTEITLDSGQERSLSERYKPGHGNGVSRTRLLLDELAARDRVELRFEEAAADRLEAAFANDRRLDIFFPARTRWQLANSSYYGGLKAFRTLAVVLTGGEDDEPVLAMAGALLLLEPPAQVCLYCCGEPSETVLHRLAVGGVRLYVQSNFSRNAAALPELIQRSVYDLLLLPRSVAADVPLARLQLALDSASGQVLVVT
jgi:hypothetical protein